MNKASAAARERWSVIIAEQQAGGQSVARFCEERGIPASSFFSWRRMLATIAGASSPAAFVEARISGARSGQPSPGTQSVAERAVPGVGLGVMIQLEGGRRIIVDRGFDRGLLLEVMAALESSPSGAAAESVL